MIVLPILALEFLIFVIAYGIRLTLRVDTNNMSICLKCYILDYIEVACVKLFVCQNKFFYQINKGKLKTIKNKVDDGVEEQKKKKKLMIGGYASRLWEKRPQIKIEKLIIDYAENFQDVKNRALFDSALAVVSNTLLVTGSNKLKIANYQLNNVSGQSNFNGVYAECVIGLALFKIVAFAFYALIIKSKYQVKA